MQVGHVPEDALVIGKENENEPLYSVKSKMFGKPLLGKYNSQNKAAYFNFDGQKQEILCYVSIAVEISTF